MNGVQFFDKLSMKQELDIKEETDVYGASSICYEMPTPYFMKTSWQFQVLGMPS